MGVMMCSRACLFDASSASCALQHSTQHVTASCYTTPCCSNTQGQVALPPLHLTYLVVHLQVPLAKGVSPFRALRLAVGQGKVVPSVTVGREHDLSLRVDDLPPLRVVPLVVVDGPFPVLGVFEWERVLVPLRAERARGSGGGGVGGGGGGGGGGRKEGRKRGRVEGVDCGLLITRREGMTR